MEKLIYSENLLKGIEAFKNSHERRGTETSYFNLFNCTTNRFFGNYGTACHYNLKYYDIGGGEEAYIINGLQGVPEKGAKKYNIYRRYVDYIINRSPLREAFLERDLDYVMDNKLTITTIELNCNYTACALTALRMSSEHEGGVISETWAYMVDMGVNEDVAFMLSHCVRRHGREFHKDEMTWHVPIAGNSININYIVDFITMLDHFDIRKNTTRFASYNNMNNFFLRGVRGNTSKFISKFSVKKKLAKSFFGRNCKFSKIFLSKENLNDLKLTKNSIMKINNAVLEELEKEKK